MTQSQTVIHWMTSAQEDNDTAKLLFDGKKYSYCLFFCQLAIEKLLKAIYIKQFDDAPPITHDLLKLAQKISISLNEKLIEQLREITTFNIEARYDIHKLRLYKKATKVYTQTYLTHTENIMKLLTTYL